MEDIDAVLAGFSLKKKKPMKFRRILVPREAQSTMS